MGCFYFGKEKNMQLFSDGEELLTKSSLASIMGKMPVTVDLSDKATWDNASYGVGGDYRLDIARYQKNRFFAFPIALPNCQEINVKIDLVSKGQWDYVFTKSPTDGIPGDCFGDHDWIQTTAKNIKVPNGAKYMGIDLRLSDNTNISQPSEVATSMQFLAETTLGSFLLAGSGEIVQFN